MEIPYTRAGEKDIKEHGIISRLSYILPADVLRMLYYTLVLP